MRKITDERKAFLFEELRLYEAMTDMTEEERSALHEWVSAGYSVYENQSLGCNEKGDPIEYLEDYRYQEEIRKEMEGLSPAEREKYIARLQGIDTIETLREDLDALWTKAHAYEQILIRYGLLQEAKDLIEEWKANKFELSPDFDDSELPFK